MDITLRIVLLAVSILFLVFVLFRIRRGKYLLKYSLIWIVLSILGVLASIFPAWIYCLATICGFAAPSNFVYFVLIIVLLISNLVICGVLSRQEVTMKNMIQEISILKASHREDNGDNG